ncbi:tetratricopeptide (TPR) repeat protein [Deinococcus metalli]|uniref:Tetratricopeptide (TPR) repeat protein n=1 Tax=Deinococcus metalli TaxID=1141878 RepID=A0A7W8NTM9_9DEIO|nr:hypothetical protein [Deinococcus metalli]MBB5378352.1 tetratricopeptide (TPR) repeat protein [Deinococcus metalli]GHF59508.1 hypothetical protein GCM10017781_39790 [Deinococcus metalli]
MKAALLLGSALLCLSAAGLAAAPRTADQWYAAGQAQLRAGQLRAAADAFARSAALNPSAANWRALADTRVRLGDYEAATQAYDRAIAGYRGRGDSVTARALEALAAPYRQDAALFVLNAASTPAPACQRALAKFEPATGVYLGAYVDEWGLGADGRLRLPAPLDAGLAVYFRYFTLRAPGQGEVFPTRFAQAVKAAGGAMHVALEPGLPLRQVTEATVLPFAQAAAASGVPIFLRFAGEFNDPANEWSRDPALYRAKFRLVHDVMARVAPNVAMVWMMMPSRLETVDAYFPGDDAVDWVGLSLYSVPFQNGDRAQPGLRVNPLDVLDPIYRKYACAHPIQVSEYASAHRSGAAPGVDYTDFAVQKLRELYWGAVLKYPRLKNVNWLNIDMGSSAFVQPKAVARRNDYTLPGVDAKVAAFRELLGVDTFRTAFAAMTTVHVPQPFPARVQLREPLQGALWLKTFSAPARVTVRVDGQPVPVGAALPYRFTLPATLAPGAHTLTVTATGEDGKTLISRVQRFDVQP